MIIRNLGLKLLQFSPVLMIIFIGYGDRFLPSPMNNWSYNIRTGINNTLINGFEKQADEHLKNNKYNNKKIDKVIEDVEQKNKE